MSGTQCLHYMFLLCYRKGIMHQNPTLHSFLFLIEESFALTVFQMTMNHHVSVKILWGDRQWVK